MNLNEEEKKDIRELVKLYFENNPSINKKLNYKFKSWDIISKYYKEYNKSYEDIKYCIESNSMSKLPIWEIFYNHFFKKKFKSNYKNTINDSTNPNDWL